MTKETQESIIHGPQYLYLGSENTHPEHSPFGGLSGTLMMSSDCRGVYCASPRKAD